MNNLKKFLSVTSLLLVCSGCATMTPNVGTKPAVQTITSQGPFDVIGLGMKRTDAMKLLDREVTVGYEKDPISGEFVPVKSTALFSTEVLRVNGVEYQVDSYIVADLKSAAPEEEDLMPLIYQNGILIGKGPAELEALRARGPADSSAVDK